MAGLREWLRNRRATRGLNRRWRAHVNAVRAARRRFEYARRDTEGFDDLGNRMARTEKAAATVARRAQLAQDELQRLPTISKLDYELENLHHRGLGEDDPQVKAVIYQRELVEHLRDRIERAEELLEQVRADLDLSLARVVEARTAGPTDTAWDQVSEALNRSLTDLDALQKAWKELNSGG